MKIVPFIFVILLPIFSSGFAQDGVEIQSKTRAEVLELIGKLKAKDEGLVGKMTNANGTELRKITSERLDIWNTKILETVCKWKIAHVKDSFKKEAVRQNLQDTMNHIKTIMENPGEGSCAGVFSGNEVQWLIQKQIEIWLLPDDEYDAWMEWGNAKLSFQGKIIALRAGMAIIELPDEVGLTEFTLRHENCFTIDGEKYALVVKDLAACPNDDFYSVCLFRLSSKGMAVLIEEVIRENYATDMKLKKVNKDCLRLDWKESDTGKEHSTLIHLKK